MQFLLINVMNVTKTNGITNNKTHSETQNHKSINKDLIEHCFEWVLIFFSIKNYNSSILIVQVFFYTINKNPFFLSFSVRSDFFFSLLNYNLVGLFAQHIYIKKWREKKINQHNTQSHTLCFQFISLLRWKTGTTAEHAYRRH